MLAGVGRGRSDSRNVSESFYHLKIIGCLSWEPRMEYLFNCIAGRRPINLPNVPDVDYLQGSCIWTNIFKNLMSSINSFTCFDDFSFKVSFK
jgi:hypothetical protein